MRGRCLGLRSWTPQSSPAAGTAGSFNRHELERRFRDVHVACQHAAGLDAHVSAAGRVALGLPADAPYF